jgi:hypothetical protein
MKIDTEHARTEDSTGRAIAQLANLSELLAVDYLASGGISATYLHQIDGALAHVKELAEIQSVVAQLRESAAILTSMLDHGESLPIDQRTAQIRSCRLGVTRDVAETLSRSA